MPRLISRVKQGTSLEEIEVKAQMVWAQDCGSQAWKNWLMAARLNQLAHGVVSLQVRFRQWASGVEIKPQAQNDCSAQ